MSKSLIFRAFEMGADGVALLGCEAGSCRYGSGTLIASHHVEDTRGILDLLGLGAERLRWVTFLPEDAEGMQAFLNGFRTDIEAMGKSPIEPTPRKPLDPVQEAEARRIVAAHDVYACQDCGKCSSSCPLTLTGKPFSPRAMANAIIMGHLDSPALERDLWSCLTCGLCYDRCPSAVDFPDFVRDMRALQHAGGSTGQQAHGGFFQSFMRSMASPGLKTDHWGWLPDDLKTDPESKMLYFGGCAPYFDYYFQQHMRPSTRNILVDSLRVLNFLDITPRLLADERCCGHDLLWSGDRENFLRLARLNVEAIEAAGIEELVTTCPECYRTFAHDYPEQGVSVNFKVTHLYDLVEREIDKGAIGFESFDRSLTFQDPCRLSRLENRPELPRKLIARLRPREFREMKDSGLSALCCGNCAWTGCDSYTKALQVKRLNQAHEAGSDLLVTACPKCQIHLRCAMQDPFQGRKLEIEMKDLISLVADTIRWE
jgi:Fe-S oxidoreductase